MDRRLPAMLNTRAYAPSTRRLLAGALLVVFTLAACGSAAAPSATPGPDPTARPTPTAVPGAPGAGNGTGVITDPGSGGGGSDPGKGGGGIVIPVPQDPDLNPLLGDANYLVPTDGLVDPRTMNVQLVRAFLDDDGGVTADLRWWSGVVGCNQLDHVEIVKDDAAKTIRLKVIEGSPQADMMCIELAELHATAVDLGELASGAWTISAEGDAPAIKLDVP